VGALIMTAFLILCISTLSLQASDTAKQVTINKENASLLEVFASIEQQTGYKFFYSNNQVDIDRKVTMRYKAVSVTRILNDLFRNTTVSFSFSGNYIVLTVPRAEIPPVGAAPAGADAASQSLPEGITPGLTTTMPMVNEPVTIRVAGTVRDETGATLPGVNVIEKGTNNGVTTGVDGAFVLNVTDGNAVLQFSFIGYETQEIVVGSQTAIDVNMTPDAKTLNEVVVIGYGTQTKEDMTGSVIAVSQKDFNKGQVTTPEQLISGKVAGVQIVSNGGAPGSGSQIRIRGGSSLNASNDPLIVVDGVPLDNAAVSGTANALSLINPNDIETFTVLKDASATAIYGSRASNGVIIITTKKGAEGDKLKVTFNSVLSVSDVTKTVDVLNGDQYREVVAKYATDSQKALVGTANTDWQDLIYRTAVSQDNNLSFSGAVKKLPYRLSVGYLNQDGIIKTSNMKRTTASLNLNPSLLDDHLKINLNVKGVLSKSRFADEGAIGAAVNMDPTQPVYSDNSALGGYFEFTDASGTPITLAPRNPLSLLEQRDATGESKRSIGNVQFDYSFHFLPELHANLNLGYDVSRSDGHTNLPATAATVYTTAGSHTQYAQNKRNVLLDFYLNYNHEFENIESRIDVTGGYSYQDFYRFEPSYAELTGNGTVLEQPAPYPLKTQNTLVSFFGRLNYTFKERYLLTATVRRDGSSRFSEDNRWGMFPSVAVAWRANREAFLSDVAFLSDLKVRLGYGVTGQQDIVGRDYPYLARYTTGQSTAMYPFGNQYYTTLRAEGYDPNIKWESTTTYNAGIDFGFFDNRVTGSVDVYTKKTKDLLSIIPPAAGTNLTNQILTNVGSIENKGVEAVLNFKIVDRKDFTFNFGVNATINKNEITNLSKTSEKNSVGILTGGIAGGTGNTVQVHTVGYPAYSFYVYKQVYDENGKPIEGAYVDRNGDGNISADDLYRYKAPNAKLYMGFNPQFTYKNWSLNMVMRASFNNYVYNNTASGAVYQNVNWSGYLLNIPTSVLKTNFVGAENVSYLLRSDYWVENASFLRMDNISLAYRFKRFMHEKVGLSLSANAQNVFVITDYSGLDPEVVGGIDNKFYPRPRVYSLGINLDF